VDEKTGIQATPGRHPHRADPSWRDERREFEYRRHGTVSIVRGHRTSPPSGRRPERIDPHNSATFIASCV